MTTTKRILMIVAMLGGLATFAAPQADAGIIFRGGPVRRAVLPPYPVARAVAPPYYRPYRAYYGPGFYGPGITVGVGVY
jgi:hypothetical protein